MQAPHCCFSIEDLDLRKNYLNNVENLQNFTALRIRTLDLSDNLELKWTLFRCLKWAT
jgi:hypothetical protein